VLLHEGSQAAQRELRSIGEIEHEAMRVFDGEIDKNSQVESRTEKAKDSAEMAKSLNYLARPGGFPSASSLCHRKV
jgi:hypothetical protein